MPADDTRDDPIVAAYSNDLSELARLMHKHPISRGDLHWIGYSFSDYIPYASPAAAQLLLDSGLEVNHADDGCLALHEAIDRDLPQRLALVETLLKGGANPNLHGFNDWTALHRAAVMNPNDFETLSLLLDYGADPEIETNIDNYATAAEEALSYNYTATAEFITTYVPQLPD